MAPKVSVLMSVYNGEPYLQEAIQSILNQTFSDFEFIIINDASTDGTPETLEGYVKQDRRIRLARNECNLGLTRSLNKGLQMAHGEYIARQDADDISLPERLAAQVDFLERHSEIGVLGTWVSNIDENDQRLRVWQTPTSPRVVHWFLLFGPALAHPSVLMRRSLLEKGAAYRPDILYAQDYDLWVRLSAKTQLANLPEVLYLRRKHKQMIGIQHCHQQERIVRAVMQDAMLNLLGEEIPERLVTGLRHATRRKLLGTAAELHAVADLIVRMYRAYTTQNTLDTVEHRQVTEDVTRRLEQFALRHMRRWPIDANRVLWQAFRLNRRLPTTKLYLKQVVYDFFKTKV